MSYDKNIIDIEEMILKGIESYGKAINIYWPSASQHADNTEACINFYVAVALNKESDAIIFAECADGDDNTKHVDYLALNLKDNYSIIIEGKRLYSGEKAGKMADDLLRIIEFKLNPDQDNIQTLNLSNRYGILLGTTFKQKIAGWWEQDDEVIPEGFGRKGWEKLSKRIDNLPITDRIFKAKEIDLSGEPYYVLYGIFRVKSD